MSPGRWLRWSGLIVASGVATATLAVINPLSWLDGEPAPEADEPRPRSELALATLSRVVEAEGELVPIETRPVTATGPGTLTEVPALGATVEAATVVFRMGDQPSVALTGDVAAWRSLDVDDEGADVEQLEANLVALGYDPDGLLSVDQTYTGYTATVVERWQTDLGAPVTGTVPLGSVVFVPGPTRVTSTEAMAGQSVPAGSTVPVLTLSGHERQLVFPVKADDLDTITTGTAVSARLPDRSAVEATVTSLGPTGDGSWVAAATIDRSAALPDGEAVPVTVSWAAMVAEDVTTVRANALTRLDTGAYVVEVVEGEETRLVEVGIGARSGSSVEIVTDLPPGTVVIAP